jgi:phosphatidylserine decarboxylase
LKVFRPGKIRNAWVTFTIVADAQAMLDKFKVLPQYIIPQHLLSRLVLHLTRCRLRPWKNLLIRTFCSWFRVDMESALEQDPCRYESFNHFFTRALSPRSRPVEAAGDCITSPVDGTISQIGGIEDQSVYQAKGHSFILRELLAGDDNLTALFRNGHFATIYLSPHDYHRIHMPVDGTLCSMSYVPGRLFAVNPSAVSSIDGLFARNERLITVFETGAGQMALIMVGALFVGSMETVWAGQVTPASSRTINHRHYSRSEQPVQLRKGMEMGRFNMGSTVILLFGRGQIEWLQEMQEGKHLIMGQALGRIKG